MYCPFSLRNAYVFRNSKKSWDPVEDMPTARDEIACGTVRSDPKGVAEEVVVAGGCTSDPTSVVEIFNLRLESWRAAKDLPFGVVQHGAVVPWHNTFIIVGGKRKSMYVMLCYNSFFR